MKCRHCRKELEHVFLDLGFAPPSNAYLTREQLNAPEVTLPLRLFVCDNCWLVQTEDFTRPSDLFDFDYAYYSSTSKTWLAHASAYVENVTQRFALDSNSFVVEIASNDGYLLRNFLRPGIPCLGIEPAHGTAQAAERLGIPVLREFFNSALARRLAAEKKADLIIGNNVFAHVPDINDFALGMRELLKEDGVITLEFPHLMQLIDNNQFDTVYHEHFSYLSLHVVQRIFAAAGLRVWDVDELPTHGGSLRVYGCHAGARRETQANVPALLAREAAGGLLRLDHYMAFQKKGDRVKDDLLMFLVEQKRAGRSVAAYGAAAKGNTLLNYAGVKPDLLSFVCDAAAAKQGKYMPGSHVPILKPDAIRERKPDFVLILPWNIASEVRQQNDYVREWGGRFVVAVPRLEVLGPA
jgi:SAM-dependent methyltransferase